ncbi:MAG TPA: hypothetical protein VFA46_05490 [Actinomycetes bacterium]|nr:hypothetical protein [Actinomycetes bacterium]
MGVLPRIQALVAEGSRMPRLPISAVLATPQLAVALGWRPSAAGRHERPGRWS